MVGMAEVKVTRSPENTLMALGLGSCVGVCAYDEQAKVAGLAHVVLPDSTGHQASPGKFADTAIPLLLEEMAKLGASPSRIKIALAGGAQLFASASGGSRLEIGPRNAAAVLSELKKRNLPVIATDLGGSCGRTVTMTATGHIRVKTIGQGERDLVSLGSLSAKDSRLADQKPPALRSGAQMAMAGTQAKAKGS